MNKDLKALSKRMLEASARYWDEWSKVLTPTNVTALIKGYEAEIGRLMAERNRYAINAVEIFARHSNDKVAYQLEIERRDKEIAAGKFIYSQYRGEARTQFEEDAAEIASLREQLKQATQ